MTFGFPNSKKNTFHSNYEEIQYSEKTAYTNRFKHYLRGIAVHCGTFNYISFQIFKSLLIDLEVLKFKVQILNICCSFFSQAHLKKSKQILGTVFPHIRPSLE